MRCCYAPFTAALLTVNIDPPPSAGLLYPSARLANAWSAGVEGSQGADAAASHGAIAKTAVARAKRVMVKVESVLVNECE